VKAIGRFKPMIIKKKRRSSCLKSDIFLAWVG